jgi:hypothetical protein
MRFIEVRQRRTRRFVAVGVLLLALAVTSPLVRGTPTVVGISYAALILGFFAFIYGTQQYSKWRRRPRIDEAIDARLGRLSDRYTMIHYPDLGTNSPEHVLVTPGGVVVVTPRDVSGKVSVDGKRWRQHRMLALRFFTLGGPSLGNPTVENELQMDRLEAIFDEQALPGEIEGVVVFMPDEIEIQMKDPESTVLHIAELYDVIREIGNEVQLGNEDRNEIIKALTGEAQFESSGARPSRAKKRIKVSGP